LILLIIKQLYVLKNADAAVMLFNQKVSWYQISEEICAV
jgi:hypothetical protein